jgi:hypothetical protein
MLAPVTVNTDTYVRAQGLWCSRKMVIVLESNGKRGLPPTPGPPFFTILARVRLGAP